MDILVPRARPAGRPAPADRRPGWIYRALGVEPVINCAGVRTNHGGSSPAPDVLAAMAAAADAFVDLDELAEGAGRRVAELTGAEWGIVTAGSAAALALATAACIAGNDPALMLRLPHVQGAPNRVVIPADQRFDYDGAIRMAGAEIVAVASVAELAAVIDDKVVMICVLGRSGPQTLLPLHDIVPLARKANVPILVDAAGLRPDRPDRWLSRGASLVAYSCGKYLRGPQSTGLLLGSGPLCRAAWLNGAPHQAFGRPMKVGKEEIVGAIAAVERWFRLGDMAGAAGAHEEALCTRRLTLLADALAGAPGIATTLIPAGASVSVPRLRVSWTRAASSRTGEDLRRALLASSPRVLIHDFWAGEDFVVLDAFNLHGDDEVLLVARMLARALGEGGRRRAVAEAPAAETDLTGEWQLSIAFLHRDRGDRLRLAQHGDRLGGEQVAAGSTGSVSGHVAGRRVSFTAVHRHVPMSHYYSFEGMAAPDGALHGTVRLGAAADEHRGPVFIGQFGEARWRAVRMA
ncbi:hypothetical protein [Labrys wisconsinensis]|uniref:Seryl-tRNA(Sec) selenium transferase n=1 Tax=Labrys wisconsinensis TaxID=425677 RepID=A0ABU0JD55_9HYPH|nr:hypothetical protein [Labrys wisconsinensis]MDQ0471047.1 seryl-tRNA(Sec) selenium transferase [Labrys wisconsinensis]